MPEPGFWDIAVPHRRARLVLEQVCDDRFALLAGFTYIGPDGEPHHVFSWHLPCTDLTSVPRPFRWFEGRHGRHTFAALLHDHQVAPGPDDPDDPTYWHRRTLADDRFAEAMGVLGVPWLRRTLMWSAVHFLTRLRRHGRWAGVAMVAWAILAALGTWLVAVRPVAALVGADWPPANVPAWLVVLALVAPIPAALAFWVPWGRLPDHGDVGGFVLRRWWCGIVMGYGVPALAPVGALTWLASLGPTLADLLSGGPGPSPWPRPSGCPPGACPEADD